MTASRNTFIGKDHESDYDDNSSNSDDDLSSDGSFTSDSDIFSMEESEEREESNEDRNDDNNEEEEVEEEEDEVVKAILKSKEVHRNHPPTITGDDFFTDISFHPVEDIIAIGSISGDIFLYKYGNEENELKSTLEVHTKACRDIEFSKDGNILYSTGKDMSIILNDMETSKFIQLYENAHEEPIYTLTVIDENVFATGDEVGSVKLWDRRQQNTTPVYSFHDMGDYVSAMLTNDSKKYLVCASGDGSLMTYNMLGKSRHVQTDEYEEELTSLGLFKRDTKIVTTTSKGKMYIFNWGQFGAHSDEIPGLSKKSIECMIPITDNIAITGDESGQLRATSLFPNRHLGVVGQHDFPVQRLDVCNDGTLIASSSYHNDVKFWNVKYFEDIDVSKPLTGGRQRQMRNNLPSSQVRNDSDFFSDM